MKSVRDIIGEVASTHQKKQPASVGTFACANCWDSGLVFVVKTQEPHVFTATPCPTCLAGAKRGYDARAFDGEGGIKTHRDPSSGRWKHKRPPGRWIGANEKHEIEHEHARELRRQRRAKK